MKKIKLYSSCFCTIGYNRSIIIDFHNNKYNYIPNGMVNIINSFQGFALEHILDNFVDKKQKEIVDSYIQFLLSNEYAFFTENAANFIKKSIIYKTPYIIDNVIIYYSNIISNNVNDIINQLNQLQCQHLQIIIPIKLSNNMLVDLFGAMQTSSLKSIELFIKHIPNRLETIRKLFIHNPRISKVVISCSPFEHIDYLDNNKKVPIIYLKSAISHKNCGKIDPSFFNINFYTFIESYTKNSCLNKKICIDAGGYIKNCPAMKHHYGHISETSLSEAIEKPEFKDCWHIKKDDIDVCQDCEFRYICSDCRAFLTHYNNTVSQPLKCNYNPYTSLWKEQNGWISVKQWRTENPGWEEKAIELRELNKKYMTAND